MQGQMGPQDSNEQAGLPEVWRIDSSVRAVENAVKAAVPAGSYRSRLSEILSGLGGPDEIRPDAAWSALNEGERGAISSSGVTEPDSALAAFLCREQRARRLAESFANTVCPEAQTFALIVKYLQEAQPRHIIAGFTQEPVVRVPGREGLVVDVGLQQDMSLMGVIHMTFRENDTTLGRADISNWWTTHWHFDDINVNPDLQDRGVANILNNVVIEVARRNGVQAITANPTNPRGMVALVDLGFKVMESEEADRLVRETITEARRMPEDRKHETYDTKLREQLRPVKLTL